MVTNRFRSAALQKVQRAGETCASLSTNLASTFEAFAGIWRDFFVAGVTQLWPRPVFVFLRSFRKFTKRLNPLVKPMMTAELGTRILKADQDAIEAGSRCLAAGGLRALPPETVYGLGADAGNGEAVARLYAAKGRPSFNPLIAHVADIGSARRIGIFTPAAEKLAARFCPGPLTLVLAKQPDCDIADLALAGLDTVGLRVPAHPVARELLK